MNRPEVENVKKAYNEYVVIGKSRNPFIIFELHNETRRKIK